MNSLVSVIIPTYNRARLLAKAIQSVINQTYVNWEILVVDNNSTDETDELVKNFNDNEAKSIKKCFEIFCENHLFDETDTKIINIYL